MHHSVNIRQVGWGWCSQNVLPPLQDGGAQQEGGSQTLTVSTTSPGQHELHREMSHVSSLFPLPSQIPARPAAHCKEDSHPSPTFA